MKIPFALRFVRWKTKMLAAAVASRREMVVLAWVGGLFGVAGGAALVWQLSTFLEGAWADPDGAALERALSVSAFSVWLAILFMAAANIITRFFGEGRLEERTQLMGPLRPHQLFAAEVLDAARLPVGAALLVLGGPLALAWPGSGLPLPLLGAVLAQIVLVYVQPLLGVLALSILVVRLLPRAVLGKSLLMFLVFFVGSLTGLWGLSQLRGLLGGQAQLQSLLPSAPLVEMLTLARQGEIASALARLGVSALVDGALLWGAHRLYRDAFLADLDRFRLGAGDAGGAGWGLPGRLLRRVLGPRVAAVLIKDLQSARRDTAQRVAFTLMTAMVAALVVADLTSGTTLSPLFLPIFFFYALFLVACQGLASFSAEGHLGDNLARLPLEAHHLLRAKVGAQIALFFGVVVSAAGLMGLSPMPLPLAWRLALALVCVGLSLPWVVAVSVLTVCLGAIFPRQGEGGAQKEISLLAMGLFIQLVALLVVSAPLSVLPMLLGGVWSWVPVACLLVWAGMLRLLWVLALRAVKEGMKVGSAIS